MKDSSNWVQCWGMAHAALSLTYFPEAERTYRLVINTAVSGKALRVRLSNKYGKERVIIGAVTAAPCGAGGSISADAEISKITFCKEKSLTLYPGQRIISDPVIFSVSAGEYLCVSVYVKKGALSSGNAINNASFLFCDGNMTESRPFTHTDRTRSKVIKTATGILGINHPLPIALFEDIELDNKDGAKVIVCFGDSLTQQGFWSNAFDKKIREIYPGRYSVINKAIGGNRLMRNSKFFLKGFYGINALSRLEENVFSYDNITHAIICIGINDMLEPGTISAPPWDASPPYEYYENLTDLLLRFRNNDIKTVVLNYMAFGGSSDARKSKHNIRHIMNEWLKNNPDIYDRLVDVYGLTVSRNDPDKVKRELLGKDNLHPNTLGGELIANAIPIDFFR